MMFQVDHHAGDAEGSLIDGQDAVVAGDDAAMSPRQNEGAVDFGGLLPLRSAATPRTNLFLKPALE